MKSSTFGFALFLVVGIALGVGGVHWWSARSQPNGALIASSQTAVTMPASAARGDDDIAVEVAAVENVTLTHSVAAVGSLSSENSVILRPEIAGRIASINFQEGGPVTKGQILIELDSSIA